MNRNHSMIFLNFLNHGGPHHDEENPNLRPEKTGTSNINLGVRLSLTNPLKLPKSAQTVEATCV